MIMVRDLTMDDVERIAKLVAEDLRSLYAQRFVDAVEEWLGGRG